MRYDVETINKRRNMHNKIKKILYATLILLLYNIFLILIPYISKTNSTGILGYRAYIIITNSMEPSINLGDVVLVKKCSEEKIENGDIITFEKNGKFVTHRIINIKENNGTKEFITKGDNNTIEDLETVKYEEVKGVKVVTIPFLGKIIMALENKIIFWIGALIILIGYLIKIEIDDRNEARRDKKRIEDEKYKLQKTK